MKKSFACAVVLGLLMLPAQAALAAVNVELVDDVDDPHAVTVLPNESFTVAVELCTTESLISGQLMIQASASDIFTLESVLFDGVIWSDNVGGGEDPGDILDPTPQLLTAGNSNTSGDIGTFAVDLVNGTGTGTMDFVLVEVSVAEAAFEGLYYLNVVEEIFGNVPGDETATCVGAPYEVTVTPVPGGLMLGLVGSALLGRMIIRRRRVR